MANPYLILWCDPTQNKIYSGWQKNTQATTPVLKQGDEIGCEIHWVKTGEYTSTMQEIAFPPSATVRLAVGRLDSAPLGGTFTITYGANTTSALAYNIEATALETALNALASIAAEGGVTVTKSGNQFRISWNDVGAYTTSLTADVGMLYPTSQSMTSEVREGSASVSRVLLFKNKQSVMAGTTSFTAVSAPSITTSQVFSNNWRVSVAPNPKEGVFSLTVTKGASTYTTASIPYNADAATVAGALNDLDVVTGETFTVLKSGDFIWDITSPSAVDTISSTSGLIGFSAMYGVLDMNTGEVEEFLSGVASAEAVLEVEVDVAGEIQTIAQTKVRVVNDLIDVSSFNVVNMGDVMPVDSVVRYDTSQALTDPQKETARENIDAASLADVEAAFEFDNIPTNNEKAAMQYSVLPSQTNPFVTMTERNPFDQDLNTDDSVTFGGITSIGSISVGAGGSFSDDEIILTTGLVLGNGITFPDSSVQTSAFDGSLYLTKDGNLSGLASTSTARTNLGLGTMAVEASTNYLAKADNLSGLASTSTARTNLGLGTMAVETATNYLAKSGNLSGLTSTSTARANIGLGTSDTAQFGMVIVGASGIQFANSSVQTTAAPPAPSSSDYWLPVWDAFNSVWSTTEVVSTGKLFYDQAGAYLGEYGAFVSTDGGPCVRVTQDGGSTWTELTAEGITFPDGTKQTTAGAATQVITDFTSYVWTTTTGASEGTPNGIVGKSITTPTSSFNFLGAKLADGARSIPFNDKPLKIVIEKHFFGLYSQALEVTHGYHEVTGSGGSTRTLILGFISGTANGTEFVYTDTGGSQVQTVLSSYNPAVVTIELDGTGNIVVKDEDGTVMLSASDASTSMGYPDNIWFGMRYVHGAYYAPDYTWECGQSIAYSTR